MANRCKAERNQKIMEFYEKGYRHIAIARMFKMKEGAVSMVISRAKEKKRGNGSKHLSDSA